jgi:flagellar basal body-associated protein FliL
MTNFEWFLLIVVVIVVPLIVAVVVTLWTIDQANKRKRANRADPQIGVKRKAALSPEEVAERKAERQKRLEEEALQTSAPSPAPPDHVSRETLPLTNESRSG